MLKTCMGIVIIILVCHKYYHSLPSFVVILLDGVPNMGVVSVLQSRIFLQYQPAAYNKSSKVACYLFLNGVGFHAVAK